MIFIKVSIKFCPS